MHNLKNLCLGSLFLAGTVSVFGQAQDAAQPDQRPAKWDTSAALGLTLTRGNSDTLLFSGNVLATRKQKANEYNFGADVTYGESDSKTTANSVHGFGQYNRLLTERFFVYGRVDGLMDEVAGVRYRFTVSPGAGYYFIKKPEANLRAEIGPGYVNEKLHPQNAEDYTQDYFTLRIAERYDQKLNDRVKLWQLAEYLPQVDRWGNYIINAEIGIDTAITKQISLRTYLQDTYHSEPPAGRYKNDLKLVAAVAYKF